MMWDDQFWIMLLNHDFLWKIYPRKAKLLMRKQPVEH